MASNSPLQLSAEERVKGSDICDDEHQVAPVTITFNGATFIGNNTDTLLEQIEAAGLTMPYRCRAGLCGACRIHVEQGDVTQPHVRAMNDAERAQGYALACSCVPATDVVVNLPAD
ncbi:2Fe-2S iron-sulfur cluster-binding protein [Vibrio agarilyticus]|uniref:2Fe-2S iron-sulfur cluster-binding protein n=1 Tax=Vibrio agarilyticus TaxID=2726741 RepID=UPI003F6E3544